MYTIAGSAHFQRCLSHRHLSAGSAASYIPLASVLTINGHLKLRDQMLIFRYISLLYVNLNDREECAYKQEVTDTEILRTSDSDTPNFFPKP